MYFVYIIKCSDDSLYTGITTDVKRRFGEHRNGKGGHYTSAKKVVKVVYTEEHPDRSSALKREAQIKGWTRQKKLSLIRPWVRERIEKTGGFKLQKGAPRVNNARGTHGGSES